MAFSGKRERRYKRRHERRTLSGDRLETRQLLASISGNVFNDLDANATRSLDEPALHAYTVYLDYNGNGILDDTRQTFVSTDVGKNIADQATVSSSLTVEGVTGSLQDVDVHLDIEHTSVSDLIVTLVSPQGVRRDLIFDQGLSVDNFRGTVLDDDAALPITENGNNFTGRWRPLTPLADFNGQNPNGVWRLEIEDRFNGNTGVLLDWSLDVANVRTERTALTSIDGQYQFDGLSSGSYAVRLQSPVGWSQARPNVRNPALSQDTASTGNDFGVSELTGSKRIEGSVWLDENGDGQQDGGEGPLADFPIFLDANNNGIFDKQPQEFEVSFGGNIPDEGMLQSPLMVTGLTSPIVDLNIHFNITHVYAADLVGVLISPAGARVTLFSRIGGSGSNFVETILDDEAEIEAAQWKTPFTGSFRPMEALSAFDGQDGNGEWIFEVSDVDFLVDGGLVNWSLEISTLDSPGEPWTRSDAQGHYQFSQLPAGDYPVRQHLPEDWSQTFPVDNEAQWAIVDQNDVAGMDFGNRQQGASPTVLAVEFNTDLLNPPNLPSGQQPTNWQLQHSDLRSIIVTFSTAVNVTPDDLRLTNLGVDAPLEDDELIMLTENHLQVSGRRLTLSFGSYELPDGVYSLEILPTVTDLTGLPLDGNGDGTAGDAYSLVGDENNGFYKIAADYNGDRGVSVFDFPALSYWFGTPVGPTGAPQYMDLNDDQGVSIFDFGRFASNFGVGVRFPAGLQSAALIQSPPPPDGFLGGEKAPDGKQDRWPSETRVARSVGAEAFQQRVFRQRGELLQEDAWRPGPSSANWLGVRAEAVDALLTGADSEILRFLSPWPGLF